MLGSTVSVRDGFSFAATETGGTAIEIAITTAPKTELNKTRILPPFYASSVEILANARTILPISASFCAVLTSFDPQKRAISGLQRDFGCNFGKEKPPAKHENSAGGFANVSCVCFTASRSIPAQL